VNNGQETGKRSGLVFGAESLRHWLISQKWFSSYLLPALPRRVRWVLRAAYLAPVDWLERLSGRADSTKPPRSINFTGAVSNLSTSSAAFRKALVEVAGLTPESHVLDVGCGFGRLATDLTHYLSAEGSYDGLDIVRTGINWCITNIPNPNTNMRFRHANVYNEEYNPEGQFQAAEYRFPYDDGSFDIVTLASVFTHMLPREVDNYLSEIVRVLKPDGRCFATYHMLTPVSLRLMSSKESIMNYKHDCGDYRVVSRQVPELAVAYVKDFMDKLYVKHGLTPTFYPGFWCGQASYWSRDSETGEQDVLVGTKGG
jgi:ubiquinone/menaquinone biosynthesis C-methylase UbiE